MASEMLSTLAAACHDREAMIIRYERHDGASGRRTIEPHQLVDLGQALASGGLGPGARRLAHLPRRPDRQGRPARRFRERPLPAEDMIAYISTHCIPAGWKHQLRFLVEAPAEAVLERINPAVGIVERRRAACPHRRLDDLWMTAALRDAGVRLHGRWLAGADRAFSVLAQRYARAVSPD